MLMEPCKNPAPRLLSVRGGIVVYGRYKSFMLSKSLLLLYCNPAEISIENQRRTISASDTATATATALQSLQYAPRRSKAERFVKLEKPAPPHTEGSAAASSSGRCRWSLNHIMFSIEMRPRVC